MTERKPPGTTFESWVDKQIRTAQERGDFDDLPGAGKPLPGAGAPVEEQWWIKGYVRREGLSGEALLPTPLQLRKEIERLPETVRELTTEQAVREVAAELNRRIVEYLRTPTGPQVAVGPVNVDDVVARWRAERPNPPRQPAPRSEEASTRQKSRWWHRFRR
ncbi:J-domain-containing protein [Saccharopolyspora sp. 5N708]|uniref:J-domain-containing protein n=1 Tax=Saccharopolyspora sp. 5N708 TaxID=3457424 RepID=UPI003FD283C7